MNTKRILIIVGTIVCLVVIVIILSVLLKASKDEDNHGQAPRLIVVSFDGFRADYISPNLTPTLWSLKSNGVTGNMFPQFVSKTFPNHFSIATGLHEETHGIISNNMYDAETGRIFKMSSLEPFWWDNGYNLPIWIANQKSSNRKSGTIMWPGCCTAYGGQAAHYQLTFNSTISFKDRIDIALSWMTNPTDPANLIMLYMEEPDTHAHNYGPFSAETLEQVRLVDEMAAYLIKNLRDNGLYNSTNVIFLSDHGMNEIRRENLVNLTQLIPDQSSFRYFGASQAISILPVAGKEEQVYQMFTNLSNKYPFKVYKKEEIPDEYYYRNNKRVQPILLEAELDHGLMFANWNKPNNIWGDHGNNNTQPAMQALFIATGPNFKKDFSLNQTSFLNTDLYPIMVKILQLDIGNYKSNGTDKMTGQFLVDAV